MGQPVSASGSGRNVGDIQHFGVKGMRWGVRKSEPSGPSAVEVGTPAGRRVQTRGGERHTASDDAVRAAVSARKARKSTVDSLSNKELQDLVQRLNLEQQLERLRPKRPSEQVLKFLSETLLGIGKDQASKYARDNIGELLKKKA